MEQFKTNLCSELIRLNIEPELITKIYGAISVAMNGYKLVKDEANICEYNKNNVTERAIQAYIDCKKSENCSVGFCKNLSIMLPKIFNFINKDLTEITSFDIRAFLVRWQAGRDKTISGATMNKYRQMINCFFEWLVEIGYVAKNPCKSIKQIKQEIKEREALSQMEMECIRSHLISLKEKMLIELLYSTGCRASEVTNIKLNDLDFHNGTVALFGKGKKHRIGYLNARAIMAIKNYLDDRQYESEYLYCNERKPHGKVSYSCIESAIRKIDARVKGEISHHLHPHLFRHTTATIAMNNGLPIQEVQLLLGHANISTTMIYAKTDAGKLKNDHLKYVV